jgi:hypothetical protein
MLERRPAPPRPAMSFALALKPPLVLVQVVPRVELAPVVRQAPALGLSQTLPVTPPPRQLYHWRSILQWLVVLVLALAALVVVVEWVGLPLPVPKACPH